MFKLPATWINMCEDVVFARRKRRFQTPEGDKYFALKQPARSDVD